MAMISREELLTQLRTMPSSMNDACRKMDLAADFIVAAVPSPLYPRCAKCGCDTGGEAALVGDQTWCHPCADDVVSVMKMLMDRETFARKVEADPDLDCEARPAASLAERDRLRQQVTDEMVERAWAAIVGRDIALQCFNASIVRADLRAGLIAALSVTRGKATRSHSDD